MAKSTKSPAPTEAGGEEAPAKKGGKFKLILLVLLPLVIGLGGGAVVALTVLKKPAVAPPAVEEGAPEVGAPTKGEDNGHGSAAESQGDTPPAAPRKQEHGTPPAKAEAKGGGGHGGGGEGEEAVPEGPQMVDFKPFVVNLADPSGKRYLKVTLSIETDTPELNEELQTKTAPIRDMILLLLSGLTYEDIYGLEGKTRLRTQIINRVNDLLTSGKVKNIYFSEFVVQ